MLARCHGICVIEWAVCGLMNKKNMYSTQPLRSPMSPCTHLSFQLAPFVPARACVSLRSASARTTGCVLNVCTAHLLRHLTPIIIKYSPVHRSLSLDSLQYLPFCPPYLMSILLIPFHTSIWPHLFVKCLFSVFPISQNILQTCLLLFQCRDAGSPWIMY